MTKEIKINYAAISSIFKRKAVIASFCKLAICQLMVIGKFRVIDSSSFSARLKLKRTANRVPTNKKLQPKLINAHRRNLIVKVDPSRIVVC